jgi:hypothetical protein
VSQYQTEIHQDLGELLHRHTASEKVRFRYYFFVTIIAAILLISLGSVFSAADHVNLWAGLSLILLLSSIFAVIAAFFLFYLKCELYLYEFGAMEQFGIWRYSARYEDIQVWHGVMGFSENPKKNNHGYSVKFPDSFRHPMFYFDSRFNEVAEQLMQMVCDAQMTRLMSDFNLGKSIDFGKVAISKEVLKLDFKTFIWVEGYSVNLTRGVFTIKRDWQSRKSNVASIQYLEIPNVLIFQALLQSINRLS